MPNSLRQAPLSNARILESLEVRPNKKLGQNFLALPHLAEDLVAHAQLRPGLGVLEIGPGLGALTEVLCRHSFLPWLFAVEIDKKLARYLEEKFPPQGHSAPRVSILHADLLKTDLDQALPPEEDFQIVGNLPYSISTEIFFHLLKYLRRIVQMSVMVQKEVGERLMAEPGDDAYGRLSLLPQIYFEIEQVLEIPGSAFFPPTKVDSTFLVLRKRQHAQVPELEETAFRQVFNEITGAIFKWRRKNLKNSLTHLRTHSTATWAAILQQAQIDGRRRGETLTLVELARLCRTCLSFTGAEK